MVISGKTTISDWARVAFLAYASTRRRVPLQVSYGRIDLGHCYADAQIESFQLVGLG